MLYEKIKRFLKKNKYTKTLYKAIKQVLINSQRKNIKKNGFEVISVIHECFDNYNINYFLDFGTLLGMIREKNFISHDLDIDIGVIVNNKADIVFLRNILMNLGFKLKYEYIFKNLTVEDSFVYKNIKIDISYYRNDNKYSRCWLFYTDSDVTINKEDMNNNMNVVELRYSKIHETEILEINGIKMRIPKNAEKLLEEKYGKEWKKPDKSWIYWKAPSAIPCKELGYRIIHA